jgi:hypothetical protein
MDRRGNGLERLVLQIQPSQMTKVPMEKVAHKPVVHPFIQQENLKGGLCSSFLAAIFFQYSAFLNILSAESSFKNFVVLKVW